MDKCTKGYTLIEILVGLTIIGLIFAFGYVSFREYSRRQAFAAVARALKADLRLAQEQALSGKKPDTLLCSSDATPPKSLDGYRFSASSGSYAILPVCSGVEIPASDFAKEVDISGAGVTLSVPRSVLFKALGQGTDIPASEEVVVSLTQVGTGNTMTVIVDSGGNIE